MIWVGGGNAAWRCITPQPFGVAVYAEAGETRFELMWYLEKLNQHRVCSVDESHTLSPTRVATAEGLWSRAAEWGSDKSASGLMALVMPKIRFPVMLPEPDGKTNSQKNLREQI